MENLITGMTKKAIMEKCDNIRKTHELKKPVIGDDLNFLMDVFKMHRQWENKSISGVNYVTVEKVLYGTRSFVLVRNDEIRIDISPKQCLNPDSDITMIKRACRNAIYPEVKSIKDSVRFGFDRCMFTGEILFEENTHIDHYDLKFSELFEIWIKDKDIKYLKSKLNKEKGEFPEDQQCRNNSLIDGVMVYFTDESILNDFVGFHNKNTHLRAVSKTANLTLLK